MVSAIIASWLWLLLQHDLFRKTVTTFRDRALLGMPAKGPACLKHDPKSGYRFSEKIMLKR